MNMNERVPVEVVGDYVICFEATQMYEDMEYYFREECGWTAEEYETIADCQWFVAEVSIWRAGECLACDYLGACAYARIEDFFTEYREDYYEDMKNGLLSHVQCNAA